MIVLGNEKKKEDKSLKKLDAQNLKMRQGQKNMKMNLECGITSRESIN